LVILLRMPEILEVSMVHSLAGELLGGKLTVERPFRAPHHSASMASLVGGGSRPRPGEVSLDYQARVSGPLLDRIDLQIEVPAVSAADLVLPKASEGSVEVKARVALARAIQSERFAGLGCQRIRTNAECDGTLLEEVASPESAGLTLLRDAADALSLSARGYHRTLRVARTLADLDGAEQVGRIHIAEALSYRGETLRRAQAAA